MVSQSIYSDPPPSYHTIDRPSYVAQAAPISTPLLSKPQIRQSCFSTARRLLVRTLLVLAFVLMIAQNLHWAPCFLDEPSLSQKRAARRQWKAEVKTHDEFKRKWDSEQAQYEEQSHQWEDQRVLWKEEEKKWEERRRDEEKHRKEVERRRQGLYWTDRVGDAHCSAYDTRTYRAVLKDIPSDLNWLEVCTDMPTTIHGQTFDKPDECYRNNRGEVYGAWTVHSEEPLCSPYWGNVHDKGCAPGTSGLLRIEAQLIGIHSGENWDQMCSTTPATIRGYEFERPTSCENKGIFGVYGVWHVPNSWC